MSPFFFSEDLGTSVSRSVGVGVIVSLCTDAGVEAIKSDTPTGLIVILEEVVVALIVGVATDSEARKLSQSGTNQTVTAINVVIRTPDPCQNGSHKSVSVRRHKLGGGRLFFISASSCFSLATSCSRCSCSSCSFLGICVGVAKAVRLRLITLKRASWSLICCSRLRICSSMRREFFQVRWSTG